MKKEEKEERMSERADKEAILLQQKTKEELRITDFSQTGNFYCSYKHAFLETDTVSSQSVSQLH